MDGMFGEMKLRVVSLFKMAHNYLIPDKNLRISNKKKMKIIKIETPKGLAIKSSVAPQVKPNCKTWMRWLSVQHFARLKKMGNF